MGVILTCERCKGNRIKFIEQEGELLQKRDGKQYSGTLVLQTFEDRKYKRIFFGDSKNIYVGAVKKFFGMTKAVYDEEFKDVLKKGNADYTCLFEFSEDDLRSGKKKFTYSMQLVGFTLLCVLSCYDFNTHKGCCYLLPNHDEAKKWAKQLGIIECEILDANGYVTNRDPLE